jgi:hypothetical protein
MAFGVNYPAFANLAKGVFVEAAVGDFREGNGPITDSQVSLLSGVHRREVKRLREEMRSAYAPPVAVSLGAQIVARWCADPRFMDTQRQPLPLPRLASRGGDISFECLVAGVSKDIRPRAVLDEWLRLGVARQDDEDRIHLLETAFIPVQGLDEKAFYFGKGLHDHMAAATHNVLGLHPPFLDRMTYYDGLSPESVERLKALAKDLAARSLQEVNAKALELQAADSGQVGANRRVTFGTYFYAAEDERGGGK